MNDSTTLLHAEQAAGALVRALASNTDANVTGCLESSLLHLLLATGDLTCDLATCFLCSTPTHTAIEHPGGTTIVHANGTLQQFPN